MYKDKYYITTLLKKHILNENEFIYTPIKGIVLHIVDGCFCDENGTFYYPITSRATLSSDVDCAIGYCDYYDDYFDSVTNRYDMKELGTTDDILDKYYNELDQLYYHAFSTGKKIIITPLSLGKDIKMELSNYGVNYNLLDEIENSKFSKKELKSMKKEITDTQNKLDFLKNAIKLYEETDEKDNNLVYDQYLSKGLINIDKLYNQVTKTLISQDEAANQLITEIAMIDLDKTNKRGILLTGDSGVGKTKLMQLISKYLDRPFLLIDSTQLTAPGYVGKNLEEYLYKLVADCHFDIEQAERAIVFFDEIDKKGSAKKSDISGQAVLNLLLKFIDGTNYDAYENAQYRNSTSISINTSNMIIVAGGAFRDVYNSKKENKIIGFGNDSDNDVTVSMEDFVKKAQMPLEFMGRFSIIHLNSLKTEDYIKILKESDESPIISAKEKFMKMDNVKLVFTNGYLRKISELANDNKTGVRGLSVMVSKSIVKPFREINKNLGVYKKIVLDEDVLNDDDNYQLIKK